ncbi:MAG: peptidoglycan DD-metalloendopeptidase family protein [Defluviitaleaceae bacterium]|nr:peptidoglycan DD-metalloendopeptidase family protein [Defluviitaleaceae bacterium]
MRGCFRKKSVALVLVALFFMPFLPFLPSLHAGASQATRQELQELEAARRAAGQRVSEQQNLLAGTEFEMSVVMEQMQELDQQITDSNEALEAITIALLYTEIRIAEAEEDLSIARTERDLQMEILRERVRDMHEQGSVGLLEVLFQAESISDFFTRWEFIRVVTQFDRELLDSLDESEERIAANAERLSRDRAHMLDLQFREELAQIEIDRRLDERRVFFAALHEDAVRYSEFLAILEEEAHAINLEFGIVQTRLHAELAEAERIRRAEEDARRAAEAAARQAEQNERLATLNSFDSFAWPLPGHSYVSSQFGNRPDPFTGRTAFHSGIDLPAPSGRRINAAEAGYVRFAGWSASWGNYIIIDHADGYSTLYAHNSRNRVSTGQRVYRGQHIGDVGTTGRSTGNHLHFEIRHNGVHRNPMAYFGG